MLEFFIFALFFVCFVVVVLFCLVFFKVKRHYEFQARIALFEVFCWRGDMLIQSPLCLVACLCQDINMRLSGGDV